MNRKDGFLILIAMVLCLYIIPSAMASIEEQQLTNVKDGAQLKIEALEAELGAEGMKEVEDYLALQASLPDTVKAMPYKALAFAATNPKSQSIKLGYIDNFDVSDKDKKKYKEELQNIWDRYPNEITEDDYAFMSELGPMIEKEALRGYQPSIGVRWTATPHRDFALYACDGSSYASYASDKADDPDEPGFEPLGFRHYNHYQDGVWGIGGASGRCATFAADAVYYRNNGFFVQAHEKFGLSSHYLSDAGIPFHSAGALDQSLNFLESFFTSNNHDIYENYVYSQWNSGQRFGDIVQTNTQRITVTNPASAVQANAAYSSQYFDYIWNAINDDPQNFGSDIYVPYYTSRCVRQTAKYNHGLYDYIM